MSKKSPRRQYGHILRERTLNLEQLEDRKLLAVDFANAIAVGEIDYVNLPNATLPAGFEQTVRVQAKQSGVVTVWSQNKGSGVADLFVYDSNQNLLGSATSGTRRVDVAAAVGDQFFVYINAPTSVANTNLYFANLLDFSIASTATLHDPQSGSGLTPRTSKGSDVFSGVDGFSTTRVDYRDGTVVRSIIQQTDGTWVENSTQGTFTFNEWRPRDKWSVYLRRANEDLQIDLFLGTAATNTGFQYNVIRAYEATGRTANAVSYESPTGATGYFSKVGSTWTERFDTGNSIQTFNYNEVSRDDWSINLQNSSNPSLTFRLDLNTKEVIRGTTPFYTIKEASIAAGWVDGTGGYDTYTFDASAGIHAAAINGLAYSLPSSSFSTINLMGGDNTDQLSILDSSNNDSITLSPLNATMTASNYTMNATNFENISAGARSSGDVATFLDSAGVDHFFSNSQFGFLYNLDGSFTNSANGFGSYQGQKVNGGADVAIMQDGPTGGDVATIGPGSATMQFASGRQNGASGFNTVHAYSVNGGQDTANFIDTPANDTFYADTIQAFMSGGNSLFFGGTFHTVNATANQGGSDIAILYDGVTQDTFTATPTFIQMQGGGNSFNSRANNFETNYGYSTAGLNHDVANVSDTLGNDTFTVASSFASITDSLGSYINYWSGFRTSNVSSQGGVDIATMFDSPVNDTVQTFANQNRVDFTQDTQNANLTSTYIATSFNSVFVTKTNAGLDTATIDPNDLVNLTLSGGWS